MKKIHLPLWCDKIFGTLCIIDFKTRVRLVDKINWQNKNWYYYKEISRISDNHQIHQSYKINLSLTRVLYRIIPSLPLAINIINNYNVICFWREQNTLDDHVYSYTNTSWGYFWEKQLIWGGYFKKIKTLSVMTSGLVRQIWKTVLHKIQK